MRRRRATTLFTTLALAMSVVPLMAMPAAAVSSPEVVATGLNSPYKLTQGPDGAIYVAEAGTGGATCSTVTGPEGDEVEACTGTTGSITRIAGTSQTRPVTGLASVALGHEAFGPTAVDFDNSGRMHVLLGLGGNGESRALLGPSQLGTLVRIPSSGDPIVVADLVAFEDENDPDGNLPGVEGPDSNPFGLAFDGSAALVADAGANALLRVTADGTISVEAVFPPTFVDPPPFLQIPGQMPMQAVPTAVEVTSGGAILVSQLTGFPFEIGAANIFGVSAGVVTPLHTGFTNIVDMAVASDGTIYVLEFASNSLLAQDGPKAALVQIRTDGTRKTLMYGDELPVPGGVAVGSDGMVYLSVCTLCGPGAGMVWKIDPSVAADSATASACDPDAVPGAGFRDTAPSQHREAIECAAWWGVVNGFSPTVYGPNGAITREQTASMIVRALMAADVVLVQGAPDAFDDDNGSVHEADINVLAAAGVILGRTETTFDPLGSVSRQEISSLVARAYALATGDDLPAGANAFSDDNGSVHEADINAVAAAGWVNGIGGGLFNPSGDATRAQFASIIVRMLSTLVDEGATTPPSS
ncbi:MAG TPA: ScyD/ScyE family protein [Acidimicrobiia bacterium]|nr:ScyD/ScyE family protein [Acidimicrobiia bacterium]